MVGLLVVLILAQGQSTPQQQQQPQIVMMPQQQSSPNQAQDRLTDALERMIAAQQAQAAQKKDEGLPNWLTIALVGAVLAGLNAAVSALVSRSISQGDKRVEEMSKKMDKMLSICTDMQVDVGVLKRLVPGADGTPKA